MKQFIHPIVVDAAEGKALPEGHLAKSFADKLPAWHPVRQLFNGPSQWLGRIDVAYGLLRLFSDVYEGQIRQAGDEGLLQAASAPDIDAEHAAFESDFPDDVLYAGRVYKIRKLLKIARSTIETVTSCLPPIRTIALGDFDSTFALLVRAVRWS